MSRKRRLSGLVVGLALGVILPASARAAEPLYDELRRAASTELYEALNSAAAEIDWEGSEEREFFGHLRLLKSAPRDDGVARERLLMVRSVHGELFILAADPDDLSNLDAMLQDKLQFRAQVIEDEVDGVTYVFLRLLELPRQALLDRVFKLAIVLMLFFVMLGMGLTLTLRDFKLVVIQPRGILTGVTLQWVLMPLITVLIGHVLGFHDTYPFIFVGMVLIVASPGGVTSNLMTYYAEGDLALSISLTSLSTALSIILTPLLLALYCAGVPEIEIPVGVVMQTIIVLVMIPLAIGMGVRSRCTAFAKRAVPFFSALGIVALLFLISAGVLSNLEKFTDTERYGLNFYLMVAALTGLGMLVGAVAPKLARVSNYQTRAISLETGLRNASLAMAIALLIQDRMGDFHSSMFFTAAIFGLLMYVAGFASIRLYKWALPTLIHSMG